VSTTAPGLRAAVRAEWLKLWSVRSTPWALTVAVACALGLGLLDATSTVRGWDAMTAADRATFDAVGTSLDGLTIAQLAFAVLGVVTATADHTTGTIDPTLLAVPRRSRAYMAKVGTLGFVALLTGQGVALAAFLLGQAVLTRQHLDAHLMDPSVLRAVTGGGLVLGTIALIGLGLGTLLRRSATALAAVVALVFLAYAVARTLEGWSYLPGKLILSNAGDVIGQVNAHAARPRLPSLSQAYLDLAGYLVIALSLGAWRTRRDP
jgi:hypothetical protein